MGVSMTELFDFEDVFNMAICNVKYFIKKRESYNKIKNYNSILKEDLLGAVNAFLNKFRNNPCICENNNKHDACDTKACDEIEKRLKNWVENLFECCDDDEKLNEFFKLISKDAMRFVELGFEPIYILLGLEYIKENAEEKLKESMSCEEYLEIIEELDDLIERTSIIAVSSYMEFEDRVFERVGVNKNLKHNVIKLGLKKMNIL